MRQFVMMSHSDKTFCLTLRQSRTTHIMSIILLHAAKSLSKDLFNLSPCHHNNNCVCGCAQKCVYETNNNKKHNDESTHPTKKNDTRDRASTTSTTTTFSSPEITILLLLFLLHDSSSSSSSSSSSFSSV
jgi:hypothetical protein